MDVHAQSRERACVLAADDAGADDGEFFRQRSHLQELRRVVNPIALEGKHGWVEWRRSRGEEHVCRAQQDVVRAGCGHAYRVSVEKAAGAGNALDIRLLEHRGCAVPGALADTLPRRGEIAHARLPPQRNVDAEQPPRLQAGKGERRLPQRLARHGAGIEAGAADVSLALDEGDAAAEPSAPPRADNADRSAAEDNQIELAHVDTPRQVVALARRYAAAPHGSPRFGPRMPDVLRYVGAVPPFVSAFAL